VWRAPMPLSSSGGAIAMSERQEEWPDLVDDALEELEDPSAEQLIQYMCDWICGYIQDQTQLLAHERRMNEALVSRNEVLKERNHRLGMLSMALGLFLLCSLILLIFLLLDQL
jgi:hypothetical protein